MAEIRKFRPGAGGDIAQALAKAMGEPVRPVAPGDGSEPSPNRKPRPQAAAGPRASSGAIWDPFLKTTPARPGKPAATSPESPARPDEDPDER